MTGSEFQKARIKLGVSGAALARALFVSERTLRGWEAGARDGRSVPVPGLVALIMRRALKDPSLRNELGLHGRKISEGRRKAAAPG